MLRLGSRRMQVSVSGTYFLEKMIYWVLSIAVYVAGEVESSALSLTVGVILAQWRCLSVDPLFVQTTDWRWSHSDVIARGLASRPAAAIAPRNTRGSLLETAYLTIKHSIGLSHTCWVYAVTSQSNIQKLTAKPGVSNKRDARLF